MFDRREFLKASTLVGVGSAATACAGRHEGLLLVPPSNPSVADMEAYLGRLDRSLHTVATGPAPFSRIFPDKKLITDDPRIKSGDELLRKNLRSLLLVGSFQDLSEEGRAYPGMQARLWNSMTEMDEAMRGTHKAMHDLTPTERADIGRALKEDPELGMRIVEAFDIDAATLGVPMERRLHLRTLALQVTNRLKQSSSMFIDEYTTKTQKILMRSTEPEDMQRQLIATLGEQEFFALRQRNIEYVERWRVAQAGPVQSPYAGPAKPKDPPGTTAITVGAVLLGIGLVVLLIGAASGSIGGAFGATVGALLALGGLITLIVGASIRAGSR